MAGRVAAAKPPDSSGPSACPASPPPISPPPPSAGVSPNSVFSWKRQLADPSPRPDAGPIFLSVGFAPAAAVEVVLPSGAGGRIAPGCDLVFGRSVIDALAAAPG